MSMKRGLARRLEIDRTVIEGSKRCSLCEKAKPLEQFYRDRSHRDGLTSRCKLCNAHESAIRMRGQRRRRTPEQLAQSHRKYRQSVKGQEWYRRYHHSAWGKLMNSKHQANYQLRWTTDPARQRHLKKLIQSYEAELARMEAARR